MDPPSAGLVAGALGERVAAGNELGFRGLACGVKAFDMFLRFRVEGRCTATV